MGWRRFGGNVKVRGGLWAGEKLYTGSTQDVEWSREAANRWLTPDGVAVGGTADLRAATRVRGALTLDAGAHTLSGGTITMSAGALDLTSAETRLKASGTVAPTLATNGQLELVDLGGGTVRLYARVGGTTYLWNKD